ncbi:hypothetical protein ACHAXA_009893 [Cyclostephanos tholiformis]|uniref:Protein kinase domain-containing protein n=1 Tax=Cyclostephanos tholiformis TaxID=382380 RepID=A0ABD3RW90_9STRA
MMGPCFRFPRRNIVPCVMYIMYVYNCRKIHPLLTPSSPFAVGFIIPPLPPFSYIATLVARTPSSPTDPKTDHNIIMSPGKKKLKKTKIKKKMNTNDTIQLGKGAFSVVRSGRHRYHAKKKHHRARRVDDDYDDDNDDRNDIDDDDGEYAIKCIDRRRLKEGDILALMDEVSILTSLRECDHIIRLYDHFDEPPDNFYLIMERMGGGELFDRIVQKSHYNEREARLTCRILLEAVGYCHMKKIAHRDLKPENLLLMSEVDDMSIKIADFGFAKVVRGPRSLRTQCGTPGYVAPEIINGDPYDEAVDMWSIGVILYILLGGYPPFTDDNQRRLFRKIRKGRFEFHDEYWHNVSNDAKDLISGLLRVDANARLSALDALGSNWISQVSDESLELNDMGMNLIEMRKFNGKRKFRAAVASVIAVNKLRSFLAFDKFIPGCHVKW